MGEYVYKCSFSTLQFNSVKMPHFFLLLIFIFLFHFKSAASLNPTESLAQCLPDSRNILTPDKPSYLQTLYKFAQNLRFETAETPKPLLIYTPFLHSQVKKAIFCSNQTGIPIRIRSGGHDYEGSSYVATNNVSFFIIDTYQMKFLSWDSGPHSKTITVGAGISLGELMYYLNGVDTTVGFPPGYLPTICVGGYISGGGYGPVTRKYGLLADNVIDAEIMDVSGNILFRAEMGEDLFWAIRGGGGSSFGIILSYTIQLFTIPPNISAFTVVKTLEDGATPLVHKWQKIAYALPKELTISVIFENIVSSTTGKNTIQVTFTSLFFGTIDDLLLILKSDFPELNVTKGDCTSLTWLDYLPYHTGLSDMPKDKFYLDRNPVPNPYYKGKSDFVQKPIPMKGLQKMWDSILLLPPGTFLMEWIPLGGVNDEISPSAIPFPHRKGNKFLVWKFAYWDTADATVAQERLAWMKGFHELMGKFVDKNPRRAYVNYRDYDLGVNNPHGKTSYERAKKWGESYFMDNFDRLAQIKSKVDPGNFFRFEQSIPPITHP